MCRRTATRTASTDSADCKDWKDGNGALALRLQLGLLPFLQRVGFFYYHSDDLTSALSSLGSSCNAERSRELRRLPASCKRLHVPSGASEVTMGCGQASREHVAFYQVSVRR